MAAVEGGENTSEPPASVNPSSLALFPSASLAAFLGSFHWLLDIRAFVRSPLGSVPIHRYVPRNAPCKLCGDGFDHHQAASASALIACPTCGQPVARANIQAVNTPKLLKPLSVSDAKSLGFSVFKKTSSGEFERQ